ncbi:MAG: hypothetical protein L0338_37345 [Acidobacteria bacterium]|nr:hypothetical protein [Acidobacteriota bacterium]
MKLDERQLALSIAFQPIVLSPVLVTPRNAKRTVLHEQYGQKLIINPELSRSLISFQANKSIPYYRWLKYKEAFSSEFVLYILSKFKAPNFAARVLDPFAGAGTTLTTATRNGCQATGIELLPVGTAAIRARLYADTVDISKFQRYLRRLEEYSFEPPRKNPYKFPHLRITRNAFSASTEKALSGYFAFLNTIENQDVRFLFWFACLTILEEVSYTRKDGQYLRWDPRSGKSLNSHFTKGPVLPFRPTILRKLHLMLDDIARRKGETLSRNVHIIEGSCLRELPRISDGSFDLVITSPPYCNRYDYTRTYALELAFLDYSEESTKELRQSLLSATVENKTKRELLAEHYRTIDKQTSYAAAIDAFRMQGALHEVLGILYEARDAGKLNNNNIPSMVENYFFEMNLIVHELARVLSPGGHVVMVNDNVQFYGEEIPVDLILSDLARRAGLPIDCIWVLSRGKGNSSQQMGIHGRNEIRKCVYVWSKPTTHQN